MQNTPDITQILTDAVKQAAPMMRVLLPIAAGFTAVECVIHTAKALCMGYRFRRPRLDAQQKEALRVNLATAKKIAEDSPPPFHVCDGCANCPISKDTGLVEEQCHLFGSSSCCIGMHIDERGRICE